MRKKREIARICLIVRSTDLGPLCGGHGQRGGMAPPNSGEMAVVVAWAAAVACDTAATPPDGGRGKALHCVAWKCGDAASGAPWAAATATLRRRPSLWMAAKGSARPRCSRPVASEGGGRSGRREDVPER